VAVESEITLKANFRELYLELATKSNSIILEAVSLIPERSCYSAPQSECSLGLDYRMKTNFFASTKAHMTYNREGHAMMAC
jgi:hypothetical protein